jgi:sugar O-acyltransferase (sialic acid O-acetyltransferase NeuD family)
MKSAPLVLIGAGGHMTVAAEVARLREIAVRGVLDAALAKSGERGGIDALGHDQQIEALAREGCEFHIAITAPGIRSRLRNELDRRGARAVSLVHPHAVISANAVIGAGCFIAAGAIVCAGAVLGPGVVVNTGAQIDHDSRIGADCHIAPGAILAGSVECGDRVFVAIGALVGPNLRIGDDSTVAAGATVLCDVAAGTTVYGTPARSKAG